MPLHTTPSTEAVRLDTVSKSYGSAAEPVVALDRVSLTIPRGTFTAVMGPSGSGKSTLLQCAAGLDRPDGGHVFIEGAEMTGADETELTIFRRERIGFVFQQFNLIPALTVLENVALPLRLAGRRVDRDRCVEVLHRVGLGERLAHRPAELSGGQQQRVAIARAIVTEPSVIFADEPTGALDSHNAREVLTLLREAVRVDGQTVVMVTHDPVAAATADWVVFLRDGRIIDSITHPTAEVVAEQLSRLGEEPALTGAGR
jgi:putative ABC transport system ATP-binding protein